MRVIHTCTSCNATIAVCEHANYQEQKTCQRTLKPLCAQCASWPGCPLPEDGKRGQEGG
jgi:hypothetical protein